MKYIKLFENYNDIEAICNKYDLYNYIINSDQTVDVNGFIILTGKNLTEIPLQFGKIDGSFNISHNYITSLKGSPYYVSTWVDYKLNLLSSLKYCAKYIGTDLNVGNNNLYSLNGIGNVKGNIYYSNSQIAELIWLFNANVKSYLEYLDIYNFQKENILYKTRFLEALKDFGIDKLPELKNYIYQ